MKMTKEEKKFIADYAEEYMRGVGDNYKGAMAQWKNNGGDEEYEYENIDWCQGIYEEMEKKGIVEVNVFDRDEYIDEVIKVFAKEVLKIGREKKKADKK